MLKNKNILDRIHEAVLEAEKRGYRITHLAVAENPAKEIIDYLNSNKHIKIDNVNGIIWTMNSKKKKFEIKVILVGSSNPDFCYLVELK